MVTIWGLGVGGREWGLLRWDQEGVLWWQGGSVDSAAGEERLWSP